jgi:hypothetical protein
MSHAEIKIKIPSKKTSGASHWFLNGTSTAHPFFTLFVDKCCFQEILAQEKSVYLIVLLSTRPPTGTG